MGRTRFPEADRLLITADASGSNGYRLRAWQVHLVALAAETGLAITVCHYPTGGSKWNPIEHRLFSQISINWAAVPLRTVLTMLACIRGVTTGTGLRVRAWLNSKHYEKKIKVSNAEMKALNLERLSICPKWSYTIRPQPRGGP